jgi:pteridine reductase
MPLTTRKVALITGAARRIGAAIARILHQNGIDVVLHYHQSEAEIKALCDEFNASRANSACIMRANLSEISELVPLIDKAAGAWGRLDILINNASQYYKTAVGKVTEQAWDGLMAANLKAPFFLSQAAVPYLEKHQGCIINLADIHSERPLKDYAVYSITKAGIAMLTKTMAKELGARVRVNAVSPGPIVWPEEENELTDELKRAVIDRTALKKEGSPNEIAKAVLYLVKDADYVTGHLLAVDAGRSLFM